MNWGSVCHTAERVAVIGTGASLRNVTMAIPAGVTTIVVNAAIDLIPHPDFWFTADTSKANRKIMAEPLNGTIYYAALWPGADFNGLTVPAHWTDPLPDHVITLRQLRGRGPRWSRRGLSTDPSGVHAGNSGFGAFGLAFLMGARRIALLGIDGWGKYAHKPGRPSHSLHVIGPMFASARDQLSAAGVEVIVGSPQSKVKCWPRTTPQEALAWLA